MDVNTLGEMYLDVYQFVQSFLYLYQDRNYQSLVVSLLESKLVDRLVSFSSSVKVSVATILDDMYHLLPVHSLMIAIPPYVDAS